MKKQTLLHQIKLSMARTVTVVIALLCVQVQSFGQTLSLGRDAVVTYDRAIYASGNVAAIKGIAAPSITTAPFVNTSQWNATETIPTNWDFNHLGQVFGVAINNTGDVYFSASILFDFVNAGTWKTSKLSLPSASIPPIGSYAIASGGNAGIYKADKTNFNTITTLVSTVNASTFASIGTSKIPNNGYGIGNIAVSNAHSKLYATNLEDGKIYAVNYNTGIISSVFDPFAADPGSSQIAEIGERLFAVAVNKEFDGTTRVYYSRLVNSVTVQNEIWSVQVNASGDFVPASNSLEIQLTSLKPINFISDIAFSVRGEMALAEKGDNHAAQGYIFFGRHNAWAMPIIPILADLNVYSYGYNSAGGVDFANYQTNNGVRCDSLIWNSVNAMSLPGNPNPGVGSNVNYGYQSMPYAGYNNNTNPGFRNEAHFVPINLTAPYDIWKGNFGDIESSDADCPLIPTDICSLLDVEKLQDDSCCIGLSIRNRYNASYFSSIVVQTGHLNIVSNAPGATWGAPTIISPQVIKFSKYQQNVPKSDSFWLLSQLCFQGTGADVLKVYFIGNAPQYDTVCVKSIDIPGCGTPVDTNCVGVIGLDDTCVNGVPSMRFQIKNNSNFTMRGISILNINPDVKVAPDWFLPIADLAPGITSPVYTVSLLVNNNATSGCFYFSACDVNVRPGSTGATPNNCCLDSIPYCIELAKCSDCDAINITADKNDSVNCCFKLNLESHYIKDKIGCMTLRGVGGTQFSILSSWAINSPVSSNNITICPPGGGLSAGTFDDFVSFCLTGTSVSPHTIAIDIYDVNGKLICTKDLSFKDCQLAKPTCANIVNDSMYCDGKETKVRFSVKNSSPFTIYQVDVRLSDTAVGITPNVLITTPPILPGATGGPYEMVITPNADSVSTVCIYLSAHNAVYTDSTSATICCTDSMGVICLPFLQCDSTGTCCVFDGLILPNGITPNGDGFNDFWVIKNSQICKLIKITVFNRWGNIVFKDDNYANNWDGVNSSGNKLAQGTYYVVIELPSGAKKAMYLDVRY